MRKRKSRILFYICLLILLCRMSCAPSLEESFDEERAWDHLLAMCSLGTRVPGSDGHRACLAYIDEHLRTYCPDVRHQSFRHDLGYGAVTLTNVIASFSPRQGDRICLAAHWDTRHVADRDPDPANRSTPIIGANDGASGTAVLLEIARILSKNPPGVGIDLLFFDGEDSGTEGEPTSFCIGSQHFAATCPSYRPRYGILLDMIGDRDLVITRERYSQRHCPDLMDRIWRTAEKMGVTAFVDKPGPVMYDDHIPFLERGISFVDIIDFDYPYWHTLDDTPEHCSPQSLGDVGRVVCRVISAER